MSYKCERCHDTGFIGVKDDEGFVDPKRCPVCKGRTDDRVWEPGLPIRLAGQIFLGRKYYCTMCGLEVKGFRDRLSAREFRITGLCQSCQDGIFTKQEEDE
jgi:hypothetical protein